MEDLTQLAAKWSRPAALLGPPSRFIGLWGPHGQKLTVVTLV
jgi:hypothetical protein